MADRTLKSNYYYYYQLSYHMYELSVASQVAIGLCLFLDRESPLFYQQCNEHDIENSKLIGCHVTTAMSVSSSKFAVMLADVIDPCPFTIFLSPLHCLC